MRKTASLIATAVVAAGVALFGVTGPAAAAGPAIRFYNTQYDAPGKDTRTNAHLEQGMDLDHQRQRELGAAQGLDDPRQGQPRVHLRDDHHQAEHPAPAARPARAARSRTTATTTAATTSGTTTVTPPTSRNPAGATVDTCTWGSPERPHGLRPADAVRLRRSRLIEAEGGAQVRQVVRAGPAVRRQPGRPGAAHVPVVVVDEQHLLRRGPPSAGRPRAKNSGAGLCTPSSDELTHRVERRRSRPSAARSASSRSVALVARPTGRPAAAHLAHEGRAPRRRPRRGRRLPLGDRAAGVRPARASASRPAHPLRVA